jgi:hypothetical protein
MSENEQMDYEDSGDFPIDGANDMNVPVNIFLSKDEKTGEWSLTADNFMPRRAMVTDGAYRVTSKSKEVLEKLVDKHITPLYEIALNNLRTKKSNYYWE